jgi:4-amino-4-deoxychorismate lyase
MAMFPSSPLLLETIKIENGEVYNLPYHQNRCDKSRKALFGSKTRLDLSSVISPPSEGLYRCRILYHEVIESIEYIPYTPKTINSLKVVPSSINYSYKYADRTTFEILLREQPDVDDVIIEKEGLLTDTSIANIAFFDGTDWFTPTTPLLEGTMRAKFIEHGILKKRDIRKEDLDKYTHVALINAMIGFKILNHTTIK